MKKKYITNNPTARWIVPELKMSSEWQQTIIIIIFSSLLQEGRQIYIAIRYTHDIH